MTKAGNGLGLCRRCGEYWWWWATPRPAFTTGVWARLGSGAAGSIGVRRWCRRGVGPWAGAPGGSGVVARQGTVRARSLGGVPVPVSSLSSPIPRPFSPHDSGGRFVLLLYPCWVQRSWCRSLVKFWRSRAAYKFWLDIIQPGIGGHARRRARPR